MQWTKIKIKHFLFSEMKRGAKADFVDLLCLTAHLEKMPSEKQMLKICTKTSLNYIQNYLKSDGVLLEFVLRKVLDDVEKVQKKKISSRDTSRRYRENQAKNDVSRQVSCDDTDKIREDKIREDTTIVKRFKRPTLEQVKKYCKEENSVVDAETFFYNYESTDWIKANGQPVKNWKSTVKSWEKRNKAQEKPKITRGHGNEALEKMKQWETGE